LASALTTVLGFSLLLVSDLPLIRQLGVFVGAGLLAALAAALLWFAQVDHVFVETRRLARARLTRVSPSVRFTARSVLLAAAVVAVVGPWRLRWHDDIRDLEAMTPELRGEALEVRALFGESPTRTAYLTQGASLAEARSALERFLAWHAERFPDSAVAALGSAMPTPAGWAAAPGLLAGLDSFPPLLGEALARHGFRPEEFAPFFDAWRARIARPAVDYDGAVREFIGGLEGSMALTIASSPGHSWFVTVAEHPPGADPPPETATMPLDQLQSLNRLFLRYRVSALRLSACGLGLVGLSVFALYGLRRGLPIFAVPAGACLFSFGLLGFAGHPLNLFHLLGAFLGVCLSHNYAIFSAENAHRGQEPPPSIRLSALTTSASFAVLAFSSIPVVSALGTTVALIVVSALVAVEVIPLAKRAPAPRSIPA
jgi:predicted exporter